MRVAQGLDDLRGVVFAAIVDHNDLYPSAQSLQRFQYFWYQAAQIGTLVVGRHHARQAGCGGSGDEVRWADVVHR